ncbi:hypothetical protein MMC07_002369 [Pseudocyphellaria aurata]|nr:hypothetical protein [Pseudocyphellaria aurata]
MAAAVRQPIDLPSLSTYIQSTIPEIKLPISVKQFGHGQSNPTYQLTTPDGRRFVLRKKPPGKLLSKTAHQVEREYRIIHALEKTGVPAPAAYALCEDVTVLGTPFYLMEYIDGRIFQDPSIPGVEAQERNEMWYNAICTLAKLHCVDFKSVGLSDFGRPSGFYNRQIKTLSTIASSQAQVIDVETKAPVGKIPHFDEMVAFFSNPAAQPKDRTTLVHGDYKIDNLVFHKTEPRVIGILDWEMSTLGHPLSDLSNLLGPFVFANRSSSPALSSITNVAFSEPAQTPGLPSQSQCISWYREVANWDPRPESRWGDSFGVFRNGVIMQGIAARYALRQATSEKAAEHGGKIGAYGDFAWGLVTTLDVKEAKTTAKL